MQLGQFQIILGESPRFEGLQFRAHSLSSHMERIWQHKSEYLRLTNEITYWTNAEVTMSTSVVLLSGVMRFILQHQPICHLNAQLQGFSTSCKHESSGLCHQTLSQGSLVEPDSHTKSG